MLLIYLSGAWLAGIFLGSHLEIPLAFSLVGLAPLPLLFFSRRYWKQIVLAAVGIVIMVTAASYAYASLYLVDEGKLRFYNDRGTAEIRGVVSADPDVRDKNTRLNLATAEIRLDGGWRRVEGTALLFVPRYPAYKYGDFLRVTGELQTPPWLDDFDYRGYLSHQGIYTTMLYPGIEVLDTGRGAKPLAWIYSWRGLMAANLGRVLPEPQASLAQGMVLGIRANIPDSLTTAFSRSGTTHVLAISGLNLSIMAGILLSIGTWFFGRRHYFYVWLALGTIWLYVIITGMPSPVIRGGIMASLFLLAELFGRQRSAIVALTFAAAVMAGIHPYIPGDASFQLSFLAMAGLVFISPTLRQAGRRLLPEPDEGGAAVSLASTFIDVMSATFGAIIAVWPVVAYYFGIFSVVGPLATLLVLMPLAQVIGWLAWLLLSYMMLVVSGLAAPSISSVAVGPISPAFIWIYYAALAAIVGAGRYRKRLAALVPGVNSRFRPNVTVSLAFSGLRKRVVLPLLVIAIGVGYTAATMPDDNLHVSFLDVGEGDAILVQRGSQQVLIDGGPSPQALNLALSRKMPFWDRTIDLLVATHPHADHLAGLVEIARRYRVGQALSSGWKDESPLFLEWQRLLNEKGIKSYHAVAGQVIDLGGGVVIEVLNPPADFITGTESDVDNNGVVVLLRAGEISFLITGDAMRDTERGLVLERAELASTLLKVAHHGADTSTCPEFLAVVNPQAAVISVGAGNKFGHPDAAVLDRLTKKLGAENVYRTDRDGTISFATDGKRLWVDVEK